MKRTASIAALTHQGKARSSNEDTIAINDWVRNAPIEAPRTLNLDLSHPLMCVVADGVGGARGGASASRLVASHLSRASAFESAGAAKQSILSANAALFDEMAVNHELEGMATTVVGACFHETRLVWFNVGDSRLYRIRDGFLRQISIDDSIAGARRSIISQALGGSRAALVLHAESVTLPAPSRWLLCSDGLYDMADDEKIEGVLSGDDISDCANLFQLAMERGGKDNISIILVSVHEQ
jgi:serine/threonine protein phosphatase PrpC